MLVYDLFEAVRIDQAAGCIILAENTGRLLLAFRSGDQSSPNCWAPFGGRMEPGETADQTVRRELHEEAGYAGPMKLDPLYLYTIATETGQFRYYNYLGTVPEEFTPHLNAENSRYLWFNYGEWPGPQHPGFKKLLADGRSIHKIELAVAAAKKQAHQQQSSSSTTTTQS